MQLVKFTTDDTPVFINPAFVVSVRKGMKDTAIQTTAGTVAVRESVEVAVRLLGAGELARDVTPSLPRPIDL